MTVLTAYAQDVKRTLDEVKSMFFDPSSTFLLLNPETAKRNKWALLEKKFHLLQIEIEKQQLVEELDILSKQGPRKASPKKFGPSPPKSGWGRQPSPEKDTLPPPPPKDEDLLEQLKEEPKKVLRIE